MNRCLFTHVTTCLLAAASMLLGACSQTKPFVAEYRPLLRELDSGLTQYEVNVQLNNRLPFAEVNPSSIGSGWAIFALALGGSAGLQLAINRHDASEKARAETNLASNSLNQPYSLVDDLDASMRDVFLKRAGKASHVATFVAGDAAPASPQPVDATLRISMKQSFSPEYQRYNVRVELALVPHAKALRERAADLYPDDGNVLYKNSITYTAILDHVTSGSASAYADAWRGNDGALTRTVMSQAMRAVAELARVDVDALAEQKLGSMATPETRQMQINGRPVRAERLASGAWIINSYSSDLIK